MDELAPHADWHALRPVDVALRLRSDLKNGLSPEEAAARLERRGRNILQEGERPMILALIARQFKSPLVFMLIFAGAATFFLKEYSDAVIIFIVLVINTLIGAYQEGRAGRAFEKLRDAQERFAFVIRGGAKAKLPAAELVPGDVVHVVAGGYIPADLRLAEAKDLSVNEAALTGEWAPVKKTTESVRTDARITEERGMAFMGTLVSSGSGTGIVVRTGHDTEIGKIAESLDGRAVPGTPFQKSIRHLASTLAAVVAVLVGLIFLVGVWGNESFRDMLLLSIAVATAAIPEGLPIAVTVVLAVGMERILARGGLVKNLIAAETLGSTTVIMTDKTGTLTEADMKVSSVITASGDAGDKRDMLEYAILASDAFIEKNHGPESKDWRVEGRPVERAIVRAGLETGIDKEALERRFPCGEFRPFSSKRRVAAIVCATSRRTPIVIVTGAPETLLASATKVHRGGKVAPLSAKVRRELEEAYEWGAASGTRFVAVAYRPIEEEHLPEEERILEGLVFGALIGLDDPVRADARESIAAAQAAGVRVVMVTGDHIATAKKIAEEVGIISVAAAPAGAAAVTGDMFARMNAADKAEMAAFVPVFARMLPEQKLELLELLRAQGEVVAMTGDGINDAPALESAGIGIALGSGTEVAKEAADLILQNDSFSIIVRAIEEGRRIVDNVKKIVAYLLSTAFGEIIVVGAALFFGSPIPVLPVQILWTNVIEEGFMTVAFAFEPAETDVMRRDPREPAMRTVLTPELSLLTAAIAFVTGLLLVVFYLVLLRTSFPIEYVRSLLFAGLSVDSIFYTFSLKNLRVPLWRMEFLSNRYLVFAFSMSVASLLAAFAFPPLRTLLHLVPLGVGGIATIIALGVTNLFCIEGLKYLIFGRKEMSVIR